MRKALGIKNRRGAQGNGDGDGGGYPPSPGYAHGALPFRPGAGAGAGSYPPSMPGQAHGAYAPSVGYGEGYDDGRDRPSTGGSSKEPSTKKRNSPYPPEIQNGIEAVRGFVGARMATPCHKCKTQLMPAPASSKFKVKAWMKRWSEGSHGKPENANWLCVAECRGCRAMTCLGCGREPKKCSGGTAGMGAGAATVHAVQDHQLAWCCRDGRLFAIWVTLARFDQVELRTLSGGGSSTSDNPFTALGRSIMPKRSKGTGYGASSPFGDPFTELAMDGLGLGGGRIRRPLEFESSDVRTDEFTQLVLGLVTVMIPTKNNRNLPAELRGMLQLGYIIDKVADLLRNDSLEDVSKRDGLYRAVLRFVHKLGSHPELSGLVQDERHYKQRSSGLEAITASDSPGGDSGVGLVLGETIMSVAGRLKQLARQSDVVLGTAECDDLTSTSGKALVDLCHEIDDVYAEIVPEDDEPNKPEQRRQGVSGDPRASAEEKWTAYHQKNCVTRSDAIVDPALFSYYGTAISLSRSHPGRIKRMVTELASMATSLPLGIFVKVGESRPDVMKCLIMGPPDSPYGYGLFDFDLYCPDQYPNVPPKMKCSTALGRRLNPNLHGDGKVCLSLLGTWPGDAAAQWQPGKSTILSVLTSIQAMIFCEDPFRNEPMYTNASGSSAERNARAYIMRAQTDTINAGMLEWMQIPQQRNGIWAKVVRAHFTINRDRILENVEKWSRSNRELKATDAVRKLRRSLDSFREGY